MASSVDEEVVEDCYLLLDDAKWNAKVRNSRLKVKRLVSRDDGFERWVARRGEPEDDTPALLNTVYEVVEAERQRRGSKFRMKKVLAELDNLDGLRTVVVTKRRTHYVIGDIRAEATSIEVDETSDVLHTLVIEGDNLKELAALRRKLGLRGKRNVAVHRAIQRAT